jgi:hypothetical protein
MCLICAFTHDSARPKERPSAAEVVDTFNCVPIDAALSERLRTAAAFVNFWQIAVLLRIAAWRIEELSGQKPEVFLPNRSFDSTDRGP